MNSDENHIHPAIHIQFQFVFYTSAMSHTMINTPAMCTYPPTPPPPTMGNTPAMCTYPLPPLYHG